jgi:hypothetical protein
MKNYYYLDDISEVQGPLSLQDLAAMHRSGRINSTTQVCEEGSENWKPYFQVAGGAAPSAQLPKKVIQPAKDAAPPIKVEKSEPQSKQTEIQGITKGQGTFLIVLLLIGIGAPFWVFLKPTPKWDYQTVEILAKTSSAASIDENYEKLAYKTVPDFSSRLESLGSQGWELVGTFLEHETSHPNFGKEDYVTGLQPNTRPQKLVMIFKRQKKL